MALTNNAAAVTQTTVTLQATVDPNNLATTYYFEYGPTTAYGTATPTSVATGAEQRVVTKDVTGLTAGTAYHYRIRAANSLGSATGTDRSFTTDPIITPPGGAPIATTDPATSITPTTAVAVATLDPNLHDTTFYFDYGLTTGYGSVTTSSVAFGSGARTVSKTLSALTASTLYHFRVRATNSSGSATGADRSFTTAPAPAPTHTLTVTRAGAGTGTVTSNVGGVNCPGTCVVTLPEDTVVILTANPTGTSTFSFWSGAGTGTTTRTVTMTADQAVTATFAPPVNRTLNITKAGTGGGNVVATGIACGADCTQVYPAGSNVVLTANTDANSTFAGWSGDANASANQITVAMNVDRNITATFVAVANQFTKTGVFNAKASPNDVPSGNHTPPLATDCPALVVRVRADSDPAGIAYAKALINGYNNAGLETIAMVPTEVDETIWTDPPASGRGIRALCEELNTDLIELGNEPQQTIATYRRLLAQASQFVRAAGKKCLMAAFGGNFTKEEWYGGMNATVPGSSLTYWDLVDGVCIHPYKGTPSGVLQIMRNQRAMIPADKPLYVTEVGFPTNGVAVFMQEAGYANGHASFTQQRDLVAQTFNILRNHNQELDLRLIVWYSYQDFVSQVGPGQWDQYSGVQALNNTPKPSRATLAAVPRLTPYTPTLTRTLTVTKAGPGAGTITSDTGGINCPGACQAAYADSTDVILTAHPGAGATFTGWSGAGTTLTATTRTVPMQADHATTGTFASNSASTTYRFANHDTTGGGIEHPDTGWDWDQINQGDGGSTVTRNAGPTGVGSFNGTNCLRFTSGTAHTGPLRISRVNWFNKLRTVPPVLPENQTMVDIGEVAWWGAAFYFVGGQRHYYTAFMRCSDHDNPATTPPNTSSNLQLIADGSGSGTADPLNPGMYLGLEEYQDDDNLLNSTPLVWRQNLGVVPLDQWFYIEVGIKCSNDPAVGWYEVWKDGLQIA